MNIIDELVTLLSLKVSPDANQQAEKFQAKLKSISTYAEVVAETLMSAATAALYFVQKANQASSEIDKLGDLTGQNKQQIQMWARAVEQMGGSASSAKSDIVSLTRALNPVMPGEYNQGLFMMFGGNYLRKFKDVNSLLDALSVKFKGMSAGRALSWASQIGISPDTLLLLRNSSKELKDVQNRIKGLVPILSDRDLRNARVFEMYWTGIKQVWAGAAEKASSALAPAIARIAVSMGNWLQKNQRLIEDKLPIFIEGVARGLSILVNVMEILLGCLGSLLKMWSKNGDKMDQARIIAYGIVAVFAVMVGSLVLLHAKFLILTAAVAAFITQLKDMWDELSGNHVNVGSTFSETLQMRHPLLSKILNKVTGGYLFPVGSGPASDPDTYDSIISEASQKYNVPENLIRGIIRKESSWNPRADNGVAQGLMQLKPGTAKDMGVNNVFDPAQNIMGGTKYLRNMLDMFNGDVISALAAYNTGPNTVKRRGFTAAADKYVQDVMNPSIPSHIGPNMQPSNTNVNITNNIQGDNAPAIASETSRKMTNTLQTLFPGGRAPAVN